MEHLSDGPTSVTSQKQERRDDSLQVSVIDASMFSTSGDVLRMHEKHFNGDTSAGKSCLCARDDTSAGKSCLCARDVKRASVSHCSVVKKTVDFANR